MVKDRFQPVTVITAVQYSNSSYESNHRNSDFLCRPKKVLQDLIQKSIKVF